MSDDELAALLLTAEEVTVTPTPQKERAMNIGRMRDASR